MVGRLTPQKGFADVLRMVPDILVRFPATRFVVFGEGDQFSELRELVRASGVSGSVSFVGHCPDPRKIFSAMDIFVLPSYNEGMPMTVLEALAARKAVVASRVGAIPEVIDHQHTGLLANPGHGEAFAAAICRLLADGDLRKRFGNNGAELVARRYSAASMATEYLHIYSKAVQERTARGDARSRICTGPRSA
jgi:glycosyltransferase involved in cell wall biosynthesis